MVRKDTIGTGRGSATQQIEDELDLFTMLANLHCTNTEDLDCNSFFKFITGAIIINALYRASVYHDDYVALVHQNLNYFFFLLPPS